jgi:N-acetylated-alpha-linked acidic dipeptidase
MRGILLFTDPRDDKEMAAANLKAYPEGPARNPSSIQRGSVVDLSLYPGDPTTPGYASREGVRRVEMESVPRIPSLPVSWAQARVLLGALEGCGGDTETVGRSEGVGYSTGPCGAVISMENEMRGEINWIHNAIGIVNGTEGDEVVVVGNHHDAWVIGGAGEFSWAMRRCSMFL